MAPKYSIMILALSKNALQEIRIPHGIFCKLLIKGLICPSLKRYTASIRFYIVSIIVYQKDEIQIF
jgi:hypothetical protein